MSVLYYTFTFNRECEGVGVRVVYAVVNLSQLFTSIMYTVTTRRNAVKFPA